MIHDIFWLLMHPQISLGRLSTQKFDDSCYTYLGTTPWQNSLITIGSNNLIPSTGSLSNF